MFITKHEIISDPERAAALKRWVGTLNLQAKGPEAKVFKIAGPMVLHARQRMGSPAWQMPFMGDESVRLFSVIMEQDPMKDGIEIKCLFSPGAVQDMNKFAVITMSMADAIEKIEGFSDWIDVTAAETTKMKAEKPPEPKLPSVKETRESESWGAW